MIDFFNQYSSGIFALLGALGGGVISFYASWMLKKRDFSLRLWDKLLDKRIKAHENVLSIALEMRVMVSWGNFEDNGDVARAPQVLMSKEVFEQWFTKFTQLTLEGSTWLTTETKRELNFVQDYLVTLHQNLSGVPSDKYLLIGKIIRQDFAELSGRLEKKTFYFFSKGINQLKLNDLDDWHKYERSETEKRLNKTALIEKWQSIKKLVEDDNKS